MVGWWSALAGPNATPSEAEAKNEEPRKRGSKPCSENDASHPAGAILSKKQKSDDFADRISRPLLQSKEQALHMGTELDDQKEQLEEIEGKTDSLLDNFRRLMGNLSRFD